MQTVLQNPEIGGFDEVVPLINPGVGEMRSHISTTFAQLKKEDLALLYFTGHGIKDMPGNFYLTTKQSELFDNNELNTGTAVEAEFIKRVVANAYAERKVVILDCCFAAAFADGFIGMDAGGIDVATQLGAKALGDKGYCVLTASTSTRYALEQKDEELSVYTRYLVEGLKTGGAASDGNDLISLRHWHEYVKTQVKVAAPAMEPAMFNAQQGYSIIIAKALVDNEQRYRKQVQKKVQLGRGRLRPTAKATLIQWQQKFDISAKQAAVIQSEVLKPYQEREKHVREYAATLEAEKAYAYPLDEGAIEELQELKRLLNLRDEDVIETEKLILGNQLLSQPVVSQTNTRTQSSQAKPALPQKSTKSHSFRFSFETVQVNERGTVIKTIVNEADCFTEELGYGVTLDMVYVPGGTFSMGAARDELGTCSDEYPQHEVVVPDFWIGKYTVTQEQWKSISKLSKVESDLDPSPACFSGAKKPVDCISWQDANEFCRRLKIKTGRAYQLPNEAQWEYACRAGTTSAFSIGPTITPRLANYDGNYTYGKALEDSYRKQTLTVGSFRPNAFGLHDMHGNVWEWCLDDWHSSYEQAPTHAQLWKKKVLRGGSWINIPRVCRSAYRGRALPSLVDSMIGFRVVCQDI